MTGPPLAFWVLFIKLLSKKGAIMAARTCDVCGKKKDLKGGKTCDKGHFVCEQCVGAGYFSSGVKQCPIDKTPLK